MNLNLYRQSSTFSQITGAAVIERKARSINEQNMLYRMIDTLCNSYNSVIFVTYSSFFNPSK